jgi:hypothetical protein
MGKMLYRAWYAKREGGYIPVAEIEIESSVRDDSSVERELEEVFITMQGETWSPNGEAREYIKSLGLTHTSMSTEDIVEEVRTGKLFIVEYIGFKELDRDDTRLMPRMPVRGSFSAGGVR